MLRSCEWKPVSWVVASFHPPDPPKPGRLLLLIWFCLITWFFHCVSAFLYSPGNKMNGLSQGVDLWDKHNNNSKIPLVYLQFYFSFKAKLSAFIQYFSIWIQIWLPWATVGVVHLQCFITCFVINIFYTRSQSHKLAKSVLLFITMVVIFFYNPQHLNKKNE